MIKDKSTVEIGDDYEIALENYLKKLVTDGKFPGTTKGLSTVHRQQKYFDERGHHILADVTIENRFDPNDEEFSSAIVFECKYHSKSRGNANIALYRAFRSTLDQFFPRGSKGFLVSTNGFSKATIEDARADKIGLMVFDPVNLTHNIIVRRRINDRYSEREALYSVLLGERKPDYPLLYWEDRFYRVEDFLSENNFAVNINALPNIPYLSENKIAEYATNVLLDARFDFSQLPIEERAAVYYEIVDKPRFVEMAPNELGRYYFDTNSIDLANVLISQIPRQRFTFAHEIGHSALHRSHLREIAYSVTDNDGFDECLTSSEVYIPRMEYQANLFASHLLMPNYQFFQQVKRSFSNHNIHHGRLYVDNQPCNMHDYIVVISEIAYHFGVSKKAAEIRLRNNGLIEYGFSHKSIGQVINEILI